MTLPFWDAWHEASVTSLGLFWTAFWAFGLGYAISSMIQVFVTRARMQRLMGKDGLWSMVLATFFGFISSSCSFAALAGARSLFTKGAGLAPSLAFLLASTNLVVELGILIAVFLSWPFVLGEYVGGILLILVMWLVVHLTQPCMIDVEDARQRARIQEQQGEGGAHCHHHHGGGGGGGGDEDENAGEHEQHDHHHHQNATSKDEETGHEDSDENNNDHGHKHEHHNGDDKEATQGESPWYTPLTSVEKWQQVALTYCMEWGMVWKDVTVGFTIAGIIAAFVPRAFFEWLFVGSDGSTSEGGLPFGQILEQTVVGPVAAFFTFIGSMGNIPLAAVLYGNNVSFAGIMAFIFSDLVVLPIVRINAKFYGWRMALYILGVFWICLVATSLVLHYAFDALDILPSADAKSVSERDYFELNYTFGLNVAFILVSAGCLAYNFHMNGLPSLSAGGSTVIEVVLFWLAWASYLWLVGGLFAGLAT